MRQIVPEKEILSGCTVFTELKLSINKIQSYVALVPAFQPISILHHINFLNYYFPFTVY